jgi:hypothetical protein
LNKTIKDYLYISWQLPTAVIVKRATCLHATGLQTYKILLVPQHTLRTQEWSSHPPRSHGFTVRSWGRHPKILSELLNMSRLANKGKFILIMTITIKKHIFLVYLHCQVREENERKNYFHIKSKLLKRFLHDPKSIIVETSRHKGNIYSYSDFHSYSYTTYNIMASLNNSKSEATVFITHQNTCHLPHISGINILKLQRYFAHLWSKETKSSF